MITKTNERVFYSASYTGEDYQISANVLTSTDGTLQSIESGFITIEDQNTAEFSLSSSDYLFINCYSSANATTVAGYVDAFINTIKTEE